MPALTSESDPDGGKVGEFLPESEDSSGDKPELDLGDDGGVPEPDLSGDAHGDNSGVPDWFLGAHGYDESNPGCVSHPTPECCAWTVA